MIKKQEEKPGKNLNDSLKKLAAIVSWFESQSEVDVEKGLEYVKEGAMLIKASRQRLSEIENEFTEIRSQMKEEKK
jgi:exonuclease VII small subunit